MLPWSTGVGMEKRTPDAAIAEAMNRVLAAEREAAEAIAAAQRSAESVIESARMRRRRILDTARRRATRMHVLGQSRLEQALRDLEGDSGGPASDIDTLRSLARDAIQNLARRLTSVDHEPH